MNRECIAQLVESFGAGGAQRLALGIAGSWAERGHRSLVVALADEGPLRASLPPGVDKVVVGGRPSAGGDILGLLNWPGKVRRLGGILHAEDVGVLQTHLPGANYLGWAVARRGTCRVFPTVHNSREFDYGNAGSRWRGWMRRRAYRDLLRRCPAMIAVADSVKAAMIDELGLEAREAERLRVVPNGVHVPPPRAALGRSAARRQLGVAHGEVLIVAAGRMTEQKNFRDLVVALEILDRVDQGWRCLVAGEGPLRSSLTEQVAAAGLDNRVIVPGHVDSLAGVFEAADIFCLPSLWEGRPLVLLEAMAAGLPVVANRITGVEDLLEDGRSGSLCPPGDTDELAGMLLKLVQDPVLRADMGATGRLEIMTLHDWEGMMTRLEAICLG